MMAQGTTSEKQQPSAPPRFRCDAYSCEMAVSACLARQQTRRQGRNGRRVPSLPAHLWLCGSGRCVQGRELAARFGAAPLRVLVTRGHE
jgi:hypothetical protein